MVATPIITFEEFPEGTVIKDQYLDRGVRFTSECFINDEFYTTSQELMGAGGDKIVFEFVIPGTKSPAVCNHFKVMTWAVEYPDSVELRCYSISGGVLYRTFVPGVIPGSYIPMDVRVPRTRRVEIEEVKTDYAGGYSLDSMHVLDVMPLVVNNLTGAIDTTRTVFD